MSKNWAEWLKGYKDDKNTKIDLNHIGNLVLEFASLKPTDHLLDIGTGLGLLGFKAYKKLKSNGKVVAIDSDESCIVECRKYIEENNISANYELYNMDLLTNSLQPHSFDVAVSRSVIMHIVDKQKAINEVYRLLKNNGKLSLFEPIHYPKTERIYKFLRPNKITNFYKFKEIEEKFRNDSNDPIANWDIQSLKKMLYNAGFSDIKVFSSTFYDCWKWTEKNINTFDEYISRSCFPFHTSTKNKFLQYVTEEDFNIFLEEAKRELLNKYFYQVANEQYIIALKSPSLYSKLNFMLTGFVYGLIFGFSNVIINIIFKFKWFYLSKIK